MEISQKLLCLMYLISVGAGVGLGLVYDALRISRMLLGFPMGSPRQLALSQPSPPSRRRKCYQTWGYILLFIQDLLFALLAGVVVILILYFLNDGQIRFLAPLGLLCGFFVYTVTVGKIIRKLSDTIVRVVRTCIVWVCRLLWKLVVIPCRGCFRLVDWLILHHLRKGMAQLRYRKYGQLTQKQVADFLQDAQDCFGLFDQKNHDTDV